MFKNVQDFLSLFCKAPGVSVPPLCLWNNLEIHEMVFLICPVQSSSSENEFGGSYWVICDMEMDFTVLVSLVIVS